MNPLIQLLPAIFMIALIAVAGWFLLRSGYQPKASGRIIVRCTAGHLFSTIWVPLMSFKAVRLGPVRLQYCPVGHHWTFVTPVDESKLSEEEKQAAMSNRDSNLP